MARIKEEDIRLNIIINGDNGRKEMLELEKSIKSFQEAVKNYTAEQKQLIKQKKESDKRFKELARLIMDESDSIEKNQKRLESLRRQQSLNTMTIKELNQHLKNTRIALSQAVPGTKQYDELNKELAATSNRLKELKDQSKETKRAINGMSDVWATLHLVNRSIKLASKYIKQATDAYLEYDEAITNAMKTTGLSRSEMDKLAESLKNLDTKTSTEQLIGIAEIGGKLGVAGDDLLGFVSAADKLNVAMGKYLGGDPEAAISSIGKLVDIFQLSPQYGLEDSMLKVGSAMNALGMASTACEGYIVEFSQRLAGIAPSADISIDKVMGLAATLDKYGQSAETSATAIGQVIMAMYKRTETFAGIAKMSLKDFTDLLNNDVNEALLRVLSGMNDGGGLQTIVSTMSEMHLNGQRASTVLGTLSKNIEDLRAQQNLSASEFERGTFVMDAYNKMNQSATAVMEKHKNAIHDSVVEIGEQLLPVVNGAMSVAEVGMKLVTLLVRYHAAVIGITIALKSWNTTRAISEALSRKENRLLREENIDLTLLADQLGNASIKTQFFAGVQFLLKRNTDAAKVAFRSLWTTIKANPIGIVVSAISLLGGIILSFLSSSKKSTKDLDDAQKSMTSSAAEAKAGLEKEKAALDDLKKAALSAAKGSEERKKAIKQLNEQYGDYLPALLSEKSSNAEIAAAIKEVNTQLERKYYLQAQENDLASLAEKKIERQKNAIEALRDKYKEFLSPEESAELTKLIFEYTKAIETGTREEVEAAAQSIDAFTSNMSDRYLEQQKEAARIAQENTEKSLSDIKKATGHAVAYDPSNVGSLIVARATNAMSQLSSATKQSLQSFKDDMVQFVSDETFIKDFYAAFIPDAKSATKPSGNPYIPEEDDIDGNKSWSLNNSKRFLAQKAALTEQFNKGEIASKREYEEALYQLEVKTLQERINSNKESGENLLKLKNELQEKIMKHEEKAEQEHERIRQIISKNKAARSGKAIDAKIQAEDTRWKKERKEYAGNARAIEAIDEQHRRNLLDIYRAGWNDEQKEAQANWQNERLLLQNKMQEKLSLVAGNEQAKKAIRDKYAQELLEIDRKHLAKLVASLRDFIKKNKDSLTPEQLEQYYKNLNSLLDKAGEVADATAELKKGMWSGSGGGSLFGVSQDQWTQLFDNMAQGKMGADDLSNAIAGIQRVTDKTFSLWDKANDLQASKEKAELEEYKQRNEEKKNILQKRLDAGIISQSDYDQEVERLENEQAEREKEMAQKQAEREKTASIVQAVINTALGVTQTLAQWGLPWDLSRPVLWRQWVRPKSP